MHWFYCEFLDDKGGHLSKEESHHATRVLRLKEGDYIGVTEGKGIVYKAQITKMSKSQTSFENREVLLKENRQNYLHIAIAPTKSLDRFETFLEKATEVGVDEITPLFTRHSERKVYKTERGGKIVMAAAKQSQSSWLPKLNEAITFHEFMKNANGTHKLIAHCEEDLERVNVLPELKNFSNTLILIGPEGDFSNSEIEIALENGFKAVSLGSKRLRTETAGIIVALAGKAL